MALELTSSKTARSVQSKSRKSTAITNNKDNSIDNVKQGLSWTEKYHPKTISELPVHNSKIKSFREWLQKALEVHNCYFDLGVGSGSPCVLAICGNSGCCKTSTVEVVCADEGVEILSWTENMWESDAITRNNLFEQGYNMQNSYNNIYLDTDKYSMYSTISSSGGYSTTARDLFRIDGVTKGAYTTKAESLQDFARHSQYPSLTLQSHTTANNTTTTTTTTATTISNYTKSKYKNNTNTTITSSSNLDQIPSSSGNISTYSHEITSFQRKIILIRDPPGFNNSSEYSNSGSSRVQGMYEFILSCPCPVVLVLSSVSGRDDVQYTVDRCLPYSVKQRVQFESLYFPPITELKVTKALLQILKMEQISKRGQNEEILLRETVQEIAVTCMGDIRHAVLQLQLLVAAPAVCKSVDSIPTGRHTITTSNTTTTSRGNTSMGGSRSKQFQRTHSTPTPLTPPLPTTATGAIHPTTTTILRSHSDNILQHHHHDNVTNSTVPIIDLTQEADSGYRELHQQNIEEEVEDEVEVVDTRKPVKRLKRGRPHLIESDDEEDGCGITTTSTTNTASASSYSLHNNVFSSESLVPAIVRTIPYKTTTATEKEVVGRRDSSYSSLRSVNKLLGATFDMKGAISFDPDGVIERSELTSELLLAFMQWNVIASLQATPRLNLTTADQLPLSETEVALHEISEVQRALHLLSEVDIYTNQQYNPNIQYDRSHTSSYPSGYITSILSRSIAASRGVGRTEEVEVAKNKGFRKTFQGVYRPKVLNLRSQQLGVYNRLTTIQQDLLEHSTSPSTTTISSNTSSTSTVVDDTISSYPYCTTNPGATTTPYTTKRSTSSAHATLTVSSLIPSIPYIPTPLQSSHTELLLNTIPYFKNITYTLRQYSGNNIVPVPIYSERIDWLIEHIYSNNSSSDVPTTAVGMGVNRINTRSDGSNRGRYTSSSSSGGGGGEDMGNTLLQHQQLIVEEQEEIDEFE